MGFCSYPRTESTAYGGHFDVRGTLQRQTAHPAYGTYTADLLRTGHTSPRGGTDVGDHPPITPVRGGGSELGGDMGRLYDLIVRHFLASVSPDCTFETTTAALAVGDERFRTSGERVIEPGFKALYPTAASEAARPPPLLREGDRLPVAVVVREGQTSPPGAPRCRSARVPPGACRATVTPLDPVAYRIARRRAAYLAEHELITLMEKHGIGTDASIPTHINNIVERRYVDIVAGVLSRCSGWADPAHPNCPCFPTATSAAARRAPPAAHSAGDYACARLPPDRPRPRPASRARHH